MALLAFHGLVGLHVSFGTAGAIAFWIPVASTKGGRTHRNWGKVFAGCMLATGGIAIALAGMTLWDSYATHPRLADRFDATFLRGVFGWMMLLCGILTVNLAWYGWMCIHNRGRHERNRAPLNIALQILLLLTAAKCAWEGWLLGIWLMPGVAVVGLATAVTNLRFIFRQRTERVDWLKEHIKALIGAGISVYTAFTAFGSVRVLPVLALHPLTWAVPLGIGLYLIVRFRRQVSREAREARLRRQELEASA